MKCWWGSKETTSFIHWWYERKWFSHPGKQFGHVLITNPVAIISLMWQLHSWAIYSREMKTYVCTKAYTQIFNAVLSIIAPAWKQPRCSSVGEWLNKLSFLSCSRILLLSDKDEWTTGMYNNFHKSLENHAELRGNNQSQNVYTVWFHLYHILKLKTYRNEK